MNPFLKRAKQPIGQAGRRAEQDSAKQFGGRLTAASGAGTRKGDFHIGTWMVEHKSTQAESLILQKEWLTKVRREALVAGMNPAVELKFTKADGRTDEVDWVAIPAHLFKELIEC